MSYLYDTPEQIYTAAVDHLTKQCARAVTVSGDCMYRTPDGLACAVGALIPDDQYDPDIEGGAVRCLTVRDDKFEVQRGGGFADGTYALADVLNKIVRPTRENLAALAEVQKAHDSAVSVAQAVEYILVAQQG